MTSAMLVSILMTLIAASTPLLLAALGELIAEKAGVLNLGVEGMMLCGAVAGFAVAFSTGSTGIGLVAGGLGTYWPQFPDLLPQLKESTSILPLCFSSVDSPLTPSISSKKSVAIAVSPQGLDGNLVVVSARTWAVPPPGGATR